MEQVKIYIQKTENNKNLPLPTYMTSGSAGVDLYAAIDDELILKPGERMLIPTGIKVALPPGYEAQIRPRSGLAIKFGITLLNSPGTIDSDYRGEIKVILVNLGDKGFKVKPEDRIAQMIVQKYQQVEFVEIDELPSTDRDEGGFGHTDHK